MKIIAGALLIAIVIISGCVLEQNTIKIGAILPLTGTASFSGLQTQEGMLMAVEEINSMGGINGRKIELFVEDSKTSAQEGVTAFNNLMTKNTSIVISALSSVSLSVSPLAEDNKISLLATVTSSPDVTRSQWTFRYYPTAEEETSPLLKIASMKGIKTIAILYSQDDFGKSMLGTLRNRFNGTVISESFALSAQDFKTELLKIKEQYPDCIMIIGFESQMLNAMRQAKELGINATIFTSSIASFPHTRESLSDIGIGVYAGVPSIYISSDNKTTQIKNEFEENQEKIFDHYVATGYDVVYLIKKIIESSGSSRSEIKHGFEHINSYEGLLGNVQRNGREFNFPLYPAFIENVEIKIIDTA